ncbi:ribose-phosphate pyrophosphokinase [Paraburkholderia sp. UYCP14C]|uniref:ribose-phosphate diphosphokinase n=1 Tax=Paraburkholderia sp. UYCP14C TaxID=2511130 RepID=UPI001020ED0F|nr:ribose-phosphate pyrophosphokinase [Paraburkholderia sp. UYCP14C]RZF25660.1 ribose-phosphate pyrophosphokinase [Paraburkholderia sp. UYCP14C]
MIATHPVIFALDASRAFGESVARHLGLALSEHEERSFEDGEHKSRPLVSVRGRDVYVVQSLYGDAQQSVNDKLCRLLFFIGALKDAGASYVTAVVPYLCYARKDKKSQPRDPVTTRYVAGLFESVGAGRVVTLDVHNLAAYQNAFRCNTEHLEANGLFVSWFAPLLADEDVVVVSPDAGGVRRADDFRERLSRALGRTVPAAFAGKLRALGVVTHEPIVGDVRDRCAVIVDDLISTGGTLSATARDCRALGAKAVYAAATHGLFVGAASETLGNEALTGIVVTNSVPAFRIPDGALRQKLAVVDCSVLFAQAIERLHSGGSISSLLQR